MNIYKKERPIRIEPGFYSFQQLADVFRRKGVTLTVNEGNGMVSLETPYEIKISNGLTKILGFGNKRRFAANQTYAVETSLDFAVI